MAEDGEYVVCRYVSAIPSTLNHLGPPKGGVARWRQQRRARDACERASLSQRLSSSHGVPSQPFAQPLLAQFILHTYLEIMLMFPNTTDCLVHACRSQCVVMARTLATGEHCPRCGEFNAASNSFMCVCALACALRRWISKTDSRSVGV
jgi:uncharacterized protein YjiS (DUF1127 family)